MWPPMSASDRRHKTLLWVGDYLERVTVVVLNINGEPAFGVLAGREGGGLCDTASLRKIAVTFGCADLWLSLEPSHVGPEGGSS